MGDDVDMCCLVCLAMSFYPCAYHYKYKECDCKFCLLLLTLFVGLAPIGQCYTLYLLFKDKY